MVTITYKILKHFRNSIGESHFPTQSALDIQIFIVISSQIKINWSYEIQALAAFHISVIINIWASIWRQFPYKNPNLSHFFQCRLEIIALSYFNMKYNIRNCEQSRYKLRDSPCWAEEVIKNVMPIINICLSSFANNYFVIISNNIKM